MNDLDPYITLARQLGIGRTEWNEPDPFLTAETLARALRERAHQILDAAAQVEQIGRIHNAHNR